MNKDVVQIYNGILLAVKKNKIMPFAVIQMKLEIVRMSEVSQRQIYCVRVESTEMVQMNLSTKHK